MPPPQRGKAPQGGASLEDGRAQRWVERALALAADFNTAHVGGMLRTATVYTQAGDSVGAARELAAQIAVQLDGRPDLIILFASPKYDQPSLLRTLHAESNPKLLVGSSSAGEFTSQASGEGLACALAITSDDLRFSAGVARNLSQDRAAAARELVRHSKGSVLTPFRTDRHW